MQQNMFIVSKKGFSQYEGWLEGSKMVVFCPIFQHLSWSRDLKEKQIKTARKRFGSPWSCRIDGPILTTTKRFLIFPMQLS